MFSLDLGTLVTHLSLKSDAFTKGINGALVRMDRAAASLRRVGTTMSIAVTAPLTLIGKKSLDTFAGFDRAMTNSLSIMGDVAPEMRKQMEDLAKTMSSKSVTSAEDLAKSYYYLASAGMTAEQQLKALPVVEKFAIAGAFDMARATDILTDAQMALGMAVADPIENMKKLTEVSDAVALAAKQSNMSVEQFGESLTNDAAIAAQNFGMELSTLMALLDVYAGKGKKGAEAGNLMGRAIRLLSSAYMENAQAFQRYGIRVVDEATGKYRNYIDILEDMNQAFVGMEKPQIASVLDELGFAALAQKSILPLLNSTEALKKFESEQKNAAGTTQEIYNKQMTSFSNRMEIVKNKISLAAMEIGQSLVPWMEKLGRVVQDVLVWWRGLEQSQKDFIVQVGIVAAVAGPTFLLLATAISVVSGAVAGLTAAITFLAANPFVLLATAVGAAGLALATSFREGGMTLENIKRIIDEITVDFENFGESVSLIFKSVALGAVIVMRKLAETVSGIFDGMFKEQVEWFRGLEEVLDASVEEGFQARQSRLDQFYAKSSPANPATGLGAKAAAGDIAAQGALAKAEKAVADSEKALKAKRQSMEVLYNQIMDKEDALAEAVEKGNERQIKALEKQIQAKKILYSDKSVEADALAKTLAQNQKFLEDAQKTELETMNKNLEAGVTAGGADKPKAVSSGAAVVPAAPPSNQQFQEMSLRRFSLDVGKYVSPSQKQSVKDEDVYRAVKENTEVTRNAARAGGVAVLG